MLRKLKVSFSSKSRKQWNVSPNICHILRLPGLEELEVDNTACVNADFVMIVDLVERSCPTRLRSISIGEVYLNDLTVLRLLRLAPGVTHLTLRGYLFPHLLEHIMSEGLLLKLSHLSIGVSAARAYSLMSATGRVVGKLMKSKEGTGILKSIDVVDKDITTKIQVVLGRASRVQILYRSKEALSRLQAQEPWNERDSEEAQCTVEIKMFADLWRGIFYVSGCGVNLLNQNIELFDFMLTAMEKYTGDYSPFLRREQVGDDLFAVNHANLPMA
ncbi:hypothetical protein AAF712_016710 [Marasmius tenuissimus]|uniref:Uncharacterized protein n=1 Tax=Marasmius tenuissimus TaxID=585030 RepID=A0ABR2Z553_9AGAR